MHTKISFKECDNSQSPLPLSLSGYVNVDEPDKSGLGYIGARTYRLFAGKQEKKQISGEVNCLVGGGRERSDCSARLATSFAPSVQSLRR